MKSEYRSSLRSKSMIRSALLSLLNKKSFESITVTEIVEVAGVNRGTFYSHYTSSYDLLKKIEESYAKELELLITSSSQSEFATNPNLLLNDICIYLENNINKSRLLFSVDNGAAFVKSLNEILLSWLLDRENKDEEYKDVVLFIASAVSSSLSSAVLSSSLSTLADKLSASIKKLLSTFF